MVTKILMRATFNVHAGCRFLTLGLIFCWNILWVLFRDQLHLFDVSEQANEDYFSFYFLHYVNETVLIAGNSSPTTNDLVCNIQRVDQLIIGSEVHLEVPLTSSGPL